MSHERLIEQLVQEALDNNLTAEEVCAEHPELLCEVLEQLRQCRKVEAQLEAIFPSSHGLSSGGSSAAKQLSSELPKIPGYEIEAILGRGGMGVVYKARHVKLNRPVALKMLLAGAFAGRPATARFLREAEAVAALRHPNVVQIYDMGDFEGRPFFTMEYMEGGSLAAKLAGAPQPSSEAADLIVALAGAVEAAHQAGIVHRDLKPANILLTGDGTPKIGDFGLARQLEEESVLTLTGTRVGTPSYMAPEQALGKASATGRPADIYALGAILYEMLTGRPPFRGETASDTERQLITQDPVPPSRLNPKVPRDIETICLKCLHKDPRRRYATAADLAKDLRRFQRNEPILARPASVLERIAKWVRRHPTLSTVLAASLVLAVVFVGGSFWLVVQQAHRQAAVEADLRELASLQTDARWEEARAVYDRAAARLEGGGTTDVRQRLTQARRDLELAIQLDAIRLKRVTRGELAFYKRQANRDYAAAFRQAGLGTRDDSPESVATRIAASPVSGALVAALYDWSACAADRAQRGWLLEIVRRADSIPGDWHERVLDPAVWEDRHALQELTKVAPVASEPVSLLLALGERLHLAGGSAVPFLRQVQQEHPADFWANLTIGDALMPDAPRQAVGAFRAALASRPRAAVGYCAVGDTFRLQENLDPATGYYEMALRLDPTYARTYNNLGLVLQARGRMDEAIVHHQKAVQLDPDYAWVRHDLGNALRAIGRLDEAYVHFQEALQRDPQNPVVLNSARSLLMRQGRGQEVQREWRTALEADPPEHEAWFGYAELCLYLGQTEEFHQATRTLLDRFGDTNSPYIAERVGRTCLLLPASDDELNKASALTERAVATLQSTPPRLYPYSRFALGLAQYRLGHWASAIPIMKFEASDVMGPCPGLIVAMAQHQSGQVEDARKTLAAAVLAYDWSAAQADSRDAWICHILRREAENLILPDLPQFLSGEYQPQDNDERVAMIGICQFQGLNGMAARLYADGFATDPRLADIPECRYRAARCAVQVGCSRDAEAVGLDETERAQWRRQALEWLQADLAAWVRVLDANPEARRGVVRAALAHWGEDSELSCVRDPGELSKLAPDERKEFVALWTEVAAVLARTEN